MSKTRTQRITKKGQVTVPKDIRKRLGIDTPGRVKVTETGEGVLVKAIPHPSEFTGSLAGETDDQGRTGSEILEEERAADAAAEERRTRE